MKSKKAQEFIDRAMKHIVADLSDHGKWQLRTAMTTTATASVAGSKRPSISPSRKPRKECGIKLSKHFARIAQFTQYKQVMGEIAPIAVH